MATICETAGKAGRSVVLGTHRAMEYVKLKTAAVGGGIASVARNVVATMKRATGRWPTLCVPKKTEEAELSLLLDRNQEILAQLGKEKLKQSEESEPSSLLDPREKSLLEEARHSEREIQSVRDDLMRRKQDEEFARTTRRATSDLKSPDAQKRRIAVRLLERMATRDAIPALTGVLGDEDPDVRTRAARTIERLVHEAQKPTEGDSHDVV
jgi:hypothetical protein